MALNSMTGREYSSTRAVMLKDANDANNANSQWNAYNAHNANVGKTR